MSDESTYRGRGPGLESALVAAAVLLIAGAPQLEAQERAAGESPARMAFSTPAPTPFDASLFHGLDFRYVGPSRGGRVTAVAGHPSHPLTFYMGSTGGGVWRTDDYGNSWRNLSDGAFATASIGVIRVAPSNPEVVYVGTGSDGIRSNIIIGKGVYRSGDAGETWTAAGLESTGQIGRMVVHPDDPDVVYAAAIGSPFGRTPDRGVYRTRDGGRTWQRVYFHSDSVGVYGLVMEPGNPDVLYASTWRAERKPWTIISGMEASGGGGIYKSTDGGDTWTKLEAGLPQGLIGKIDLSISPAAPQRVYAIVEAPDPEEGVYRSDDAGRTWRLTSNQAGLMNRPFYYTNITVDPRNPDLVYVNNEAFYRSTDGGRTFERRPTPHGDNHDMWINPDNPDIFIQANDGGVNVTLDGGRTWSTQHNQATAELYQVYVDDRFPYWLYAGQQDNTTIAVPALPPAEPAPGGPSAHWKEIGGCETGPSVPKPGDATIVYSSCKGRFGRFSHRTGQEQQYYVGAVNMYGVNPRELPYRFQRTVPIEVSPHDPNTVYHASQYVHRTRDDGVTWERISPDLTAFRPERQVVSGGPITRDITGEEHYSTLYVVRESAVEPGVLWTGANDGPVHVSRDGGATWTDVTPPDMPPEGRVNSIDPSVHRPGKAYVAGYRYLLDDWRPYAYRTTDYGRTWTRLADGSNGIPADHPVRVVREDPDREGLLYAGTEFGLFVSLDDGATWQPFQLGLPVTPVTDIRVHRKDLVVATMGRGFWILDNLTPLHQWGASVAEEPAHLFEPREAHRVHYRTSFGRVSDPSDPEYPEAGATIDYWLASEPAEEVTLEILNARGELLRGFSSSGEGARTDASQGMREPRMERSGGPRLPATPGMHRVTWDLRHPGPWSPDGGGRGGPLAVPGDYQVRLSVGGRSQTRSLRVLVDPRVEEDGVTLADLHEQLDLGLRVRDALSEARRAAAEAQSMADRLGPEGGPEAARAARAELSRIRSELVTATGMSYPQPMLLDQIAYLYSMLDQADQKPGRDAHERFRQLREALDGLRADLARLERSVAALQDRNGR